MASSSVPIFPLPVCVVVVVVVIVVIVSMTYHTNKRPTRQQQPRQLSQKKPHVKPHYKHAPPPTTAPTATPLHSYYETRSAHHTPIPFPDVTVTPYAQTTNHAPHDTTTGDDTREAGVSHVVSPMATPCPRVNVWRREDWCGVFV